MYKVFSLEIYIHYFLSKKKVWQHNIVRRACENDWFGSGYVLFIRMLLYLLSSPLSGFCWGVALHVMRCRTGHMGDPPSSCHHDASVRSIDIGLEEDRLTGKSSEKKKKWLISLGIPMMYCWCCPSVLECKCIFFLFSKIFIDSCSRVHRSW